MFLQVLPGKECAQAQGEAKNDHQRAEQIQPRDVVVFFQGIGRGRQQRGLGRRLSLSGLPHCSARKLAFTNLPFCPASALIFPGSGSAARRKTQTHPTAEHRSGKGQEIVQFFATVRAWWAPAMVDPRGLTLTPQHGEIMTAQMPSASAPQTSFRLRSGLLLRYARHTILLTSQRGTPRASRTGRS